MRHDNLFAWVDDTRGFYEKLQTDFKRDDRKIQIASLALMVSVLYLARNFDGMDYAAVVVLVICVNVLFYSYIDHSNRNFMMHMIDWHIAREGEAKDKDKVREAEHACNQAYRKRREAKEEDV